MPAYGTEQPKRFTKLFGVLLATLVAIGSIALIVVTQEPKQAVSSPTPAKAAIVPQIADAKSEAEIILRGKSFCVLKRNITLPYTGEIKKIFVQEGQAVEPDQPLVEYKLDRNSVMQVQKTLYPDIVLTLKKNQYERQVSIEKLRKSTLSIKKLELEKVEKELSDLRELESKQLAYADAVKNKERQVQSTRKEFLEIEDTIKQQEADLSRIGEDLKYYEERQKRELDNLEYQAKRTYNGSNLPIDIAYLKSPIAGQVIWIAPELTAEAEPAAGFMAATVAAPNSMTVRCKVHELDLVKLKPGNRGAATFDAIPDQRYALKISKIPWVSRNPALEVPADYDIECELEKPDDRIKDGLTCNVRVTVAQ